MASVRAFEAASAGLVNKPAGTIAGDVLIAAVVAAGAAPSLAGWSSQAAVNNSGFYFLSMLSKVAGESEPASYTFAGGGIIQSVVLAAIQNADTITIIDGTPATSTTGALGSVTTGADGSLLLAAGMANDALSAPAGMSEVGEGGPGGTYSLYGNLSQELRATAGATGARTVTTAGSMLGAVMLAILAGDTPTSETDSGIVPGLLLPV